ncbi:MAG: hypothetical protein AB7S38_37685 [Vulcanimicrobiota bacterium]
MELFSVGDELLRALQQPEPNVNEILRLVNCRQGWLDAAVVKGLSQGDQQRLVEQDRQLVRSAHHCWQSLGDALTRVGPAKRLKARGKPSRFIDCRT